MLRLAWMTAGLVCVAIGGVGVIVPGLPSTVFFIAAAACFTRSSPRLEAWVLGLPGVGAAIQDYRDGVMPKRAKATALVMMSIAVATSAWLLRSWVSLVVIGVGLIGAVVVLRIPTKPETTVA